MFLRKSFQAFLVLHSEVEPVPVPQPQPHPQPARRGGDRESPPPPPQRVIDWRWLEGRGDTP